MPPLRLSLFRATYGINDLTIKINMHCDKTMMQYLNTYGINDLTVKINMHCDKTVILNAIKVHHSSLGTLGKSLQGLSKRKHLW